MASSLPSFSALVKPPLKCNTRRSLQVRAQGFRDEGRSSNIVDANLCVLRERIDVMRIKERLERCCSAAYGWNYAPGYNYKLKKDRELSQFFELVSLACWYCWPNHY
ncbi:hypothetical protein L1049_002113 [Liquidambar formosana]|uniref:Uncharacterized protein n=1 Tax=Liquidambar formosana TaxID=63359 RepID=A0AAP0NEZ6_LIQFO